MTRSRAAGIVASMVLCVTAVVGQGAAHAAPDRLTIGRTGTDAAIIKVPARNDTLAVGNRLRGAVYTWSKGDPPCDPTGSTARAMRARPAAYHLNCQGLRSAGTAGRSISGTCSWKK